MGIANVNTYKTLGIQYQHVYIGDLTKIAIEKCNPSPYVWKNSRTSIYSMALILIN